MTDVLPRWVILPTDPPKLRRWLTARQAEQAAYDLSTRRSEASIRLVRAIGGGWAESGIETAKADKRPGPR